MGNNYDKSVCIGYWSGLRRPRGAHFAPVPTARFHFLSGLTRALALPGLPSQVQCRLNNATLVDYKSHGHLRRCSLRNLNSLI